MAEEKGQAYDEAPGMDYAEHHRTYDRFIWLSVRTTVAVVVILILMAMFLL